ncbi:two-component sensor histidine kinase [Serratia marcescens]|uniref:sensor histidine kinase n=1 Tax=Serratia nematodiphila TaxID=458197 RepID=UPI00164FE065|nr:ATP-binding protein [Serratia nematodiphila]MBH2774397.1 two-component sensor histidine kinase [Serratia marcescens]
MNQNNRSLLFWVSVRIVIVAIVTLFTIILAMWGIFAAQYFYVINEMPASVYERFLVLRENPSLDIEAFHEIVDTYWGLDYSTPSLTSLNWGWLFIFLAVVVPLITLMCVRIARPLTAQFRNLTEIAEIVAQGNFKQQAELVQACPDEIIRFSINFNDMVNKLALYEREIKASHVALAHELRSPLTGAMGRLQGMIDNVFPASQAQLNMVMTQLKNLSYLTDDLYFLSLASAGQLKLSKNLFTINSVLKERVAWLKPQLEAAGMSISIKESGQLNFIGDEFRLGQVFSILIENMLRYCSQGDRMCIRLEQTAQEIVLAFQDTGPGVAQDYLPQIFERFTRGETSRARDSGGSGLGLSIAKAICVAHHGTITASLPAGKGLLITINLPLPAQGAAHR